MKVKALAVCAAFQQEPFAGKRSRQGGFLHFPKEMGVGGGHKAGLIQKQLHSANTVGFEVGLGDLFSPKMFSLLHISSLGIYSFGLNSII